MYATLASRDVDCCLIPESPFYLDGKGGLYEYIEKQLKENGHMVIVIAEGAGQELLSESMQQDASGNKLLQDVGLWISQGIKVLNLTQTVLLKNYILSQEHVPYRDSNSLFQSIHIQYQKRVIFC
jgi:6-phosphofructokinase